jgi:transposase
MNLLSKGETDMTHANSIGNGRLLVAIDVAKEKHDVLVELPTGQRKKMIVRNCKADFDGLAKYLERLGQTPVIALEPTADYHRGLAYFLKSKNFEVRAVSSLAVARTREALHNSWDKNDRKDAHVILHLLRTGVTQIYFDPVIEQVNDLRELSSAYLETSLRKTQIQNSLINHYLALYFPEAEAFMSGTRDGLFSKLLLHFPLPASICTLSESKFVFEGSRLLGAKKLKQDMLGALYLKASESVGIPISPSSQAVAVFRLTLEEHIRLCKQRTALEKTADQLLQDNFQYKILKSVPGIGPVIALTILAEAGDLRRFGHVRQFLKYCGLDLSTYQSGTSRGKSHISKRGNAHLRRVFWLSATIAARMHENPFQAKFGRYTQPQPTNADLKRKAYTAVAAKMARVVYGLIKHQTLYRAYYQDAVPGGMNPFIISGEAGSNSVTS